MSGLCHVSTQKSTTTPQRRSQNSQIFTAAPPTFTRVMAPAVCRMDQAVVCELINLAQARAVEKNEKEWHDLREKMRSYPLGLDDLDWLTDEDLHYFVPTSVRSSFEETLKLWQTRDTNLVQLLRAASPETVDSVRAKRRSWSSHL